ncbi:MAG: sensor histidine kinase [Verrucomicrobiota bacterium]
MPAPHLSAVAAGLRRALAGGLLLAGGCRALATEAPPAQHTLTAIADIRALSLEQANREVPVRVRGVITRFTPYELFIQNGADAIFVRQNEAGHPGMRLGDYVEISGTTHPGHLSPYIKDPTIKVIDHPGLPVPQAVRYADLATIRSDCQWVEVAGVVRTIEARPGGDLTLRVLFDGQLLRVEVGPPSATQAGHLLGARLRLRGVISGAKTPQRKLIEPALWTDYRPDTFVIETPGPADVFAAPFWSVGTLLEQGGSHPSGEMVRVGGLVTCQPLPQLIFLRDGERSLEIRLQRPAELAVGDRIEAVGFPEMGLVQPVLQSALARRIAAGAPPPPRRLRAADLLDFQHEAGLVEVEGELREIFRHGDGLTLLLTDEGKAFNTDIANAQLPAGAVLPPVGSRLSLVGVCSIERVTPPDTFQIVTPAAIRLRLRSLGDLHVLVRPPWWTPARLLAAIALLSLFALGALGWIWTLNRRVRAQTRIILGNVRKHAVLEERNRIARELHDTLEQQLAGATILLDAVDTVIEQPRRAREGLNTARAMLRHSLDEAQQAVADLRSNDLIERDLGPLIEQTVRERLHATGIQAEFRRDGSWPELDTMVKQHLLRIVLESVTNAVKHAAPHRITVSMRAAPDRVELQVADDGCGFDVQDRVRRGPGEFGLIGLQERAEKIGARLTIRSAPSRGTTVAVALPLAATTAI